MDVIERYINELMEKSTPDKRSPEVKKIHFAKKPPLWAAVNC